MTVSWQKYLDLSLGNSHTHLTHVENVSSIHLLVDLNRFCRSALLENKFRERSNIVILFKKNSFSSLFYDTDKDLFDAGIFSVSDVLSAARGGCSASTIRSISRCPICFCTYKGFIPRYALYSQKISRHSGGRIWSITFVSVDCFMPLLSLRMNRWAYYIYVCLKWIQFL